MKKVIFALGVLILIFNTGNAQSPKFKQSNNSDVMGQAISRIDGNASFPRNNAGGVALDFTGDGLKDFIMPFYYSPSNNYDVQFLKLFKNMGNGVFNEVTKQYVNPNISNGLYLIGANDGKGIVFDFNKDGKMDFAFPSLWENNDYVNYDTTYGLKKFRDYYYKYNPNYVESRANGGYTTTSFFYQDSIGIKKGYDLFDRQHYVSSQAVMNADINNDGFEDLLAWQVGYLTKDSTITDWIDGITIWKNNGGKGFKFNQLNFLDTTNKTEFETDQEGSIGIADYNGDGYKDILVFGTNTPYIYNRFHEAIDSSAWDRKYRQYDHSKMVRETRLYLNNKGDFDQNNYIVIPNIRAKYSRPIDLNNDGKMDFIALWKNYLEGGKTYSDSSTNKDGINNQIYVAINKGNNVFEDQTSKYFPSNFTKFSRMSLIDIELTDVDGDGTIDIFPISGVMDTLNGSLGRYATDTVGSHATFYYKNYNNQYFKKQNIDSLFIVKGWNNFKELKNLDSIYLNVYIPFSDKYNPIPKIKGEYLLDNLYYLNEFYPEDFNNDKKLDLLGFSGFDNKYQAFLSNKYGFKEIIRLNIGMSLFTQCNVLKPIFNTTKYSICSGDSLKLTVTNINKGDSLRWYYGSKSDLTNVTNKTFTDTTKLFVTRTDSLGCFISSDTISLIKYAIPSAPTLSRDTANYLMASANGISWYKDGTALTDTTQKIKPTVPGSYTVKTTQNGCISSLSTPYYYLVTDVINLSTSEFIKLAPNPFINQLNFDFIVKGYQRLNLEVFDIASGTKVSSQPNLTAGTKITLGQLSSGTYVIRVTSTDNKISYQFKMVKL
jgi:hypothetical protein